MIFPKNISIFLAILYITIVITSNTSAQLSTVQASLSENRINDAIKKACPTYEDNADKNIKGAVTNIIKSCLPQGNQPPTSPNPNPNSNPLDQNIIKFTADIELGGDDAQNSATIVITDTKTQKSNTYEINGENGQVSDEFVIPVGDVYEITVTPIQIPPPPHPGESQVEIDIAGNNCNTNSNTCTATMGNSVTYVTVCVSFEGECTQL